MQTSHLIVITIEQIILLEDRPSPLQIVVYRGSSKIGVFFTRHRRECPGGNYRIELAQITLLHVEERQDSVVVDSLY